MTVAPGHRVLVVEDNPEDRDDICGVLRSRGDSPRAAGTVAEALVALEEEEFCYFVFDQALPFDGSAPKAFISGGERLVVAARATDKRRTTDGDVTPIVALTSHSEGGPFITGLFELGISTFVSKPVALNTTYFLEKLRGALARAGRDDHAKCAALVQRRVTATVKDGVRVVIDGVTTSSRCAGFFVNGERRDLQDSKFVMFLRLVAAHLVAAGSWSDRQELGMRGRNATTAIREAFVGLVPDGLNVIEGDGRGNFRLNPGIVVESVAWDVLASHSDGAVQRIALEGRKREGRR
jgi:CheY-like chemotaxis protein